MFNGTITIILYVFESDALLLSNYNWCFYVSSVRVDCRSMQSDFQCFNTVTTTMAAGTSSGLRGRRRMNMTWFTLLRSASKKSSYMYYSIIICLS